MIAYGIMLQASSKVEYGLRCLLRLAAEGADKALSLSEIAQRERLPKAYAEQILLRLRHAGLVKSIRGTQGGFLLAQPPSTITVAAVLQVLEGIPFKDTCDQFNRKTDCGHLSECSIRPVWQLVSRRVWETLESVTLEQLRRDEKTVSHRLERELPVLSGPMWPGPATARPQ